MEKLDLSDLLKRHAPVTWLFCGDSITQGAVHTRGWRDYTQLFGERLGELGRNEDVTINSACGGWTLAVLAPRLEERVLRFRPDVLFLMFGVNDAAGGGKGLQEFGDAYADVISRAREAGIGRVVVQTITPMVPLDPEAAIEIAKFQDEQTRDSKLRGLRMRLEHLPSYSEAISGVARRLGVALVDHWSVWMEAGGARGQLLDGGFHPNEYGHRLIAHTIFRACGMWDEGSWTCRLFVPV